MNQLKEESTWFRATIHNFQMSLLGHGALVILLSLFAGFFLTFDMLQGVKLWPVVDWNVEIPGTVRGWRVAHSGGLLNGVLLIVMALCLTKVRISLSAAKFVFWAFVLTGWGNTLFYWFGNFSMNRGLSGGDTPYGQGDIYGLLSYLSGASVMVLTVIATFLIARSAFSSTYLASDNE